MAYRLYRSYDGVLIRTDAGEIELSAEDAVRLGAELAPKAPRRNSGYTHWTSDLTEKVRSLYVDDGLGPSEIGRLFGRKGKTISSLLNRLGIPAHHRKKSAAAVAANKARWARKAA